MAKQVNPFDKFLHGIGDPTTIKTPTFKPYKPSNKPYERKKLPKVTISKENKPLPKIELPTPTPAPKIALDMPQLSRRTSTSPRPASTPQVVSKKQAEVQPSSNVLQVPDPMELINRTAEEVKPDEIKLPTLQDLQKNLQQYQRDDIAATTPAVVAQMFPIPNEEAIRYSAMAWGIDNKLLSSEFIQAYLSGNYEAGMNAVDFYTTLKDDLISNFRVQSQLDRVNKARGVGDEATSSDSPTSETAEIHPEVTAPAITGDVGKWTDMIATIGKDYSIDNQHMGLFIPMVSAIIYGESGGDPSKLGDGGKSFGLLQLYTGDGQGNAINPKTGNPYTPDELKDPYTNLSIGLIQIAAQFRRIIADPNIKNTKDFLWELMASSGHPSRKGLFESPTFFANVYSKFNEYVQGMSISTGEIPESEFLTMESIPMPFDGDFGITSYFGANDVAERKGAHTGVDFRMPMGTPIKTILPGKVIAASLSGGFGLTVLVEHNIAGETWISQYAHLTEADVQVGQIIPVGTVIGLSGGANGDARDGTSTGAHLHLGIKKPDGTWTDPMAFLRGRNYLVAQTGMTPEQVMDKIGWSEDYLNQMIEKYVNGYDPEPGWRANMNDLILKLRYWNTGFPQHGPATEGQQGDEGYKVGAASANLQEPVLGTSYSEPGSTIHTDEELKRMFDENLGRPLSQDEITRVINTIKFAEPYMQSLASQAYERYTQKRVQELMDKGVSLDDIQRELPPATAEVNPAATTRYLGWLDLDKYYEDFLPVAQRPIIGSIANSMKRVTEDLYGGTGWKDLLSLTALLPLVNMPAGIKSGIDNALDGNWDGAIANFVQYGTLGILPPALTDIPRAVFEDDNPYVPQPGEDVFDWRARTEEQYNKEINPLKIRQIAEMGLDPFVFMGMKPYAAMYTLSNGFTPSSGVVIGMAALGPVGKAILRTKAGEAAANAVLKTAFAKSSLAVEHLAGVDTRVRFENWLHKMFPEKNLDELGAKELKDALEASKKPITTDEPLNIDRMSNHTTMHRPAPAYEEHVAINKFIGEGKPEYRRQPETFVKDVEIGDRPTLEFTEQGAENYLTYGERIKRGLPIVREFDETRIPIGATASETLDAVRENLPKRVGVQAEEEILARNLVHQTQNTIIGAYHAGALSLKQATIAFVKATRDMDDAELASWLERRIGRKGNLTNEKLIAEFIDQRSKTALSDVMETALRDSNMSAARLADEVEKRGRDLWRETNDLRIAGMRQRLGDRTQRILNGMDSAYRNVWRNFFAPVQTGMAKYILGFPGYAIGNLIEDVSQGALHGGGIPARRGNWRQQLRNYFGENWETDPTIARDLRMMMTDPILGKAVKQAYKDFQIEAPWYKRFMNIFRTSETELRNGMTQGDFINAVAQKAKKNLEAKGHSFTMQSIVDYTTQAGLADFWLNSARKWQHRARAQYILQNYKKTVNRFARDTAHLRSEEFRAMRRLEYTLPAKMNVGERSEILDMMNAAIFSENPEKSLEAIKNKFGRPQVLATEMQKVLSQEEAMKVIPEGARSMLARFFKLDTAEPRDRSIEEVTDFIDTAFREAVHSENIMQAAHNVDQIIPEIEHMVSWIKAPTTVADEEFAIEALHEAERIAQNLFGTPYQIHRRAALISRSMPDTAERLWNEADNHIKTQWDAAMESYKSMLGELKDRLKKERWDEDSLDFIGIYDQITELNRKTQRKISEEVVRGSTPIERGAIKHRIWEDHYNQWQELRSGFATNLSNNNAFAKRINKWIKSSATEKHQRLMHTLLRSLETTDAWTIRHTQRFIEKSFGGEKLYETIFKDRVRFDKHNKELARLATTAETTQATNAPALRAIADNFDTKLTAWKDSTSFAERARMEQDLNKNFRQKLGATYKQKNYVEIIPTRQIYEERHKQLTDGLEAAVKEHSSINAELGNQIADAELEISRLEASLRRLKRIRRTEQQGARTEMGRAAEQLADLGPRPAGRPTPIPPEPTPPRLQRVPEEIPLPRDLQIPEGTPPNELAALYPEDVAFTSGIGSTEIADRYDTMIKATENKIAELRTILNEGVTDVDNELDNMYSFAQPMVKELNKVVDKYLTYVPIERHAEIEATQLRVQGLIEERARLKQGRFTPEKAQRLSEIEGEIYGEIQGMNRFTEVQRAEGRIRTPEEEEELSRLIAGQNEEGPIGLSFSEQRRREDLLSKVENETITPEEQRELAGLERQGKRIYVPSPAEESATSPTGELATERAALTENLPTRENYTDDLDQYSDYVFIQSVVGMIDDKVQDLKRLRMGRGQRVREVIGKITPVERTPMLTITPGAKLSAAQQTKLDALLAKKTLTRAEKIQLGKLQRRAKSLGGESRVIPPKADISRTGEYKAEFDRLVAEREKEINTLTADLENYAATYRAQQEVIAARRDSARYRAWKQRENVRRMQQVKNRKLMIPHEFDVAGYYAQYGEAMANNTAWRSAMSKWAAANRKWNNKIADMQAIIDKFNADKENIQSTIYSLKEGLIELKSHLATRQANNNRSYVLRMREIDDIESAINNATGWTARHKRTKEAIAENLPDKETAELEAIIATHKDLGVQLQGDIYSDPNFADNFISEVFKNGVPPKPSPDAPLEDKLMWFLTVSLGKDIHQTATDAAYKLAPDVYRDVAKQSDEQVNKLLEVVGNIRQDQRLQPEYQQQISAWVDSVIDAYKKIPDWDKKNVKSIRTSALESITNDARTAFTRYDQQTVMDQMMQHIFPFWTYETRRFGRLMKNFERHPWTLKALLTYYSESDRGYMPLPNILGIGSGIFMRPDAGTLWTGFGLLDPRSSFHTMPGLAGVFEDGSNWYEKGGMFSPLVDTVTSGVNAFQNRDARFLSDSFASGVVLQNPLNIASMLGTPIPGIGATLPGGSHVAEISSSFRDLLGDSWNVHNVDIALGDMGFNPDSVRAAADVGDSIAPANRPMNPRPAKEVLAEAERTVAWRSMAIDLFGNAIYRSPNRDKYIADRKDFLMKTFNLTEDELNQAQSDGGINKLLDLHPRVKEQMSLMPGAGVWQRRGSAFATKDERDTRIIIDQFQRDLRAKRSGFTQDQAADDAKLTDPNSDFTHAAWIENHAQREKERANLAFKLRQDVARYRQGVVGDAGVPITNEEWAAYNASRTTSYAKEAINPVDQVLNDYYKIDPNDKRFKRTEGHLDDKNQWVEEEVIDWPLFYRERDRFLETLPQDEPELIQAVLYLIDKNKTPTEKQFEQASHIYSYYRTLPRYTGLSDADANQFDLDKQEIYDNNLKIKSLPRSALAERQHLLYLNFDLRKRWEGISIETSQERRDFLLTPEGRLMSTWFTQNEPHGPTTID